MLFLRIKFKLLTQLSRCVIENQQKQQRKNKNKTEKNRFIFTIHAQKKYAPNFRNNILVKCLSSNRLWS